MHPADQASPFASTASGSRQPALGQLRAFVGYAARDLRPATVASPAFRTAICLAGRSWEAGRPRVLERSAAPGSRRCAWTAENIFHRNDRCVALAELLSDGSELADEPGRALYGHEGRHGQDRISYCRPLEHDTVCPSNVRPIMLLCSVGSKNYNHGFHDARA
jgi:hypothetical protein